MLVFDPSGEQLKLKSTFLTLISVDVSPTCGTDVIDAGMILLLTAGCSRVPPQNLFSCGHKETKQTGVLSFTILLRLFLSKNQTELLRLKCNFLLILYILSVRIQQLNN